MALGVRFPFSIIKFVLEELFAALGVRFLFLQSLSSGSPRLQRTAAVWTHGKWYQMTVADGEAGAGLLALYTALPEGTRVAARSMQRLTRV